MTYINKVIHFWKVQETLPPSYKIGISIDDYNEVLLLLNTEQEQYHNEHPDANPR